MRYSSLILVVLSFFTFDASGQKYFRSIQDPASFVWPVSPGSCDYTPNHGALISYFTRGSSSSSSGFFGESIIYRLNNAGDTVWSKVNTCDTTYYHTPSYTLSGNYYLSDTVHFQARFGRVIRNKRNGNYIIATIDDVISSIQIKQIDSNGNYISSFLISDTGSNFHNILDVNILPAGDDSFYLLIPAYKYESGTSTINWQSAYVLKLTSNYNVLWNNEYLYHCTGSATVLQFDHFTACNTKDGGVAFLQTYDTSVYSAAAINRYFLNTLRPDGTLNWHISLQNCLNINLSTAAGTFAMFNTSDSGLVFEVGTQDVVVGYTSASIRIVRFDKNGNVTDSTHIPSVLTANQPVGGVETTNGKLLFAGGRFMEFFAYDRHLNFLYSIPSPFPENYINYLPQHSFTANQFGGAFYTGEASIAGFPSFHICIANFDSLFNCYPAFVTGEISQDDNHDCTFNSTDLKIRNACARLHETTTGIDYYGYTNDTGYYVANVPLGNYTLSHPTTGYKRNECGGPYSHSITSPVALPNNNYFDTLVPGLRDLILSGHTTFCIPGDTTWVLVWAKNNGTVTVDTFVNVIIDPRVTYISSVPAPISISGDTLRFRARLLSDSVKNFNITCRVNTSTTMGDTLIFQANSPFPNNIYPGNDSTRFSRIVLSAYDPNFVAVNQQKYFPQNNTLAYTVGFQNTGTYRAKCVSVLDTLDSHLDPATFNFVSGTHGVPQIKWLSGNRTMFVYDNINLPDSTSDEPGSHGEFNYTIRLKNTTNIGDTILNSASIYFDYNLPVKTNTTLNIVGAPLHYNAVPMVHTLGPVAFSPNPSNGEIDVQLPQSLSEIVLIVTDLSGRVIFTDRVRGATAHVKTHLESGMYILKLVDTNNGSVFTSKMTVVK